MPVAVSTAAEAYQQYWFGWVRAIHFVAAYVFFFNFLFRIYWGFAGNEYASWHNFIPLGPQRMARQAREASGEPGVTSRASRSGA